MQAHGWPAFRQRETAILKDLLAKYPYDSIIACGGGVVESDESRRHLQEAAATMPVINVLREREAVLRNLQNLLDTNSRPDYGEDEEQLMNRREPLYRACASHVFVNLTCDDGHLEEGQGSNRNGKAMAIYPLKYKQVGESFLRLIRFILGDARRPSSSSSRPASRQASPGPGLTGYSRGSISHLLGSHGPGPDVGTDRNSPSLAYPGNPSATSHFPMLPRKADPTSRASLLTRRTTAVSLTFPDLAKVEPSLVRQITQGVDAVEVRVDMLACMQPASYAVRSQQPHVKPVVDVDEVALQVEMLRKSAPGLTILFTLRSHREGGSFFDDRNLNQRQVASPYSQALYFQLLELAIATGVELLDVEMGWDPDLTRRLIEGRERTKIVVSYHDLKGALQWDTEVPLKLYQRAAREFGSGVHLVELIGTGFRSRIEQNSHLTSFAARLNSEAAADRSLSLPPLMALNMQLAGRYSRPFNDVLGFISHPALPIAAGPGQMSLKETMETLVRFGVFQPCHFHLLAAGQENELIDRVLRIAFEEFGLPYHLHSWPTSDGLELYLLQNKAAADDPMAWQGEAIDGGGSSGLFLAACNLSEEAKNLFDIMDRRHPAHLTLAARVVRAVDILARQDVSQSLLATERGRRVPNVLGDVRGPLIGCHTMPGAVYRTLSAHMAPINAPGFSMSALVVVLKAASPQSVQEVAAIEIATRSTLFAMAKLGFGDVYMLEEEKGAMETAMSEVLQLVRHSSNDVLDDNAGWEQTQTALQYSRCQFSNIEVRHLSESGGAESIRKPRAIVIVGGDDESQKATMQTLWKGSTPEYEGLVLPKETWDTLFGGTVLRIPSAKPLQYGGQHDTSSGVAWERGGWIHVAPWILDRDRVHKGVVEAWARRSAPVQSMQAGWQ